MLQTTQRLNSGSLNQRPNNMFGIIIINYNQYQLTREFLDSLTLVKNANQAMVYIADVSTNRQKIDTKKYPFKHLAVADEKNNGYAYGVNQGVKYFLKRGIDKFCVINNDVILDNNFLVEVEKGFINKHVFGGKIYYAPGYEYHKSRYKKSDLGKVIWYAGGINDWANVYTKHRGVDEVDHGQYEDEEKTDFITGCLFCFDKFVWDEVGPWDEKYFLYYEDGDYCERAKRKGFDLIYNPKIIIWHKVSQSTGGPGSSINQKYQNTNRIRFGLKYAPIKTKIHLLKEKLLPKI